MKEREGKKSCPLTTWEEVKEDQEENGKG